MNRFASVFVALGLATAGSTAFAEQGKDQAAQLPATPQPVQMSDAQLDSVAAGLLNVGSGLVTVQVGLEDIEIPVRVLNNSVNNNTVQVPVAATVSAAVAVLGNASSFARQLGRQN
jgi:hypothetical protein